jgi:amidase
MTRKVTRDTVFYAFSADLEPVLEVEPGERVHMETHDCFCGQMQTAADTVETLDWERVNPATGPVYIRGAQPGDILAVEIEDVQVADQGAMVTIPGEGRRPGCLQRQGPAACAANDRRHWRGS